MLGEELSTLGADVLGATRALTVAVVDAHDVVYSGIKTWIDDEPSLNAKVNGHYHGAEKFLAAHPHTESGIDVVLAGLDAGGNGPDFATLRQLCESGHRVVVYSRITDHDVIRTAVDSGAVTYLVKCEGREHLVEAVRAAAGDTPYVGPAMAVALSTTAEVQQPILAPREREVLIAWFRTDSKDLVAQQLFLAPSTVRTHLQRIRAKYAAAGRPAGTKAALVARAIQDHIIEIGDL